MNLLKSFYLSLSRQRFVKKFKPLGYAKKRKFLVSLPSDASGFVRMLPFVHGLARLGSMAVLVPQKVLPLCESVKANKWDFIPYKPPTDILSKEYRRIKDILEKKKFHYLIEL
ncbi:MAG: hypothetical protein JSW02_02980, partial [candidate division WOR-3 bacterium]